MEWKVIKPATMGGTSPTTNALLGAQLVSKGEGVYDLDLRPSEALTLPEMNATKKFEARKVLAVKQGMKQGYTLDQMAHRYKGNGRGWSRRTLADIRAALSEAETSKQAKK